MTSVQPDEFDDGGDVARDPDAIQREIEATRAELADTIDAIADRLSPKRAASRGAKAVKAQVSSVLDHEQTDADRSRRIRPDRVLLAVGAVAVVGTGIMVWRSRRR
jgi:hypothetical protein